MSCHCPAYKACVSMTGLSQSDSGGYVRDKTTRAKGEREKDVGLVDSRARDRWRRRATQSTVGWNCGRDGLEDGTAIDPDSVAMECTHSSSYISSACTLTRHTFVTRQDFPRETDSRLLPQGSTYHQGYPTSQTSLTTRPCCTARGDRKVERPCSDIR